MSSALVIIASSLVIMGFVFLYRSLRKSAQLRETTVGIAKSANTAKAPIKLTRAQRGRSKEQITARHNRPNSAGIGKTEKTSSTIGTISITLSTELREVPFPNMDGPAYRIEYVDQDGVISEREIIVQWINVHNNTVYVTAFCKVRGAPRSFRADRISSMTDSETGMKIVDPIRYFKRLSRAL